MRIAQVGSVIHRVHDYTRDYIEEVTQNRTNMHMRINEVFLPFFEQKGSPYLPYFLFALLFQCYNTRTLHFPRH